MPTTPADAPEVRDNAAANRFEVLVEGRVVGIADYVEDGGRRIFTHTEIEPDRRGHGLGRQLVEAALDDTGDRGLVAVPQCSFVRAVLASRSNAPSSSGSQHGPGAEEGAGDDPWDPAACPVPPRSSSRGSE
jgi:predicted GNAT family acetyltransferase